MMKYLAAFSVVFFSITSYAEEKTLTQKINEIIVSLLDATIAGDPVISSDVGADGQPKTSIVVDEEATDLTTNNNLKITGVLTTKTSAWDPGKEAQVKISLAGAVNPQSQQLPEGDAHQAHLSLEVGVKTTTVTLIEHVLKQWLKNAPEDLSTADKGQQALFKILEVYSSGLTGMGDVYQLLHTLAALAKSTAELNEADNVLRFLETLKLGYDKSTDSLSAVYQKELQVEPLPGDSLWGVQLVELSLLSNSQETSAKIGVGAFLSAEDYSSFVTQKEVYLGMLQAFVDNIEQDESAREDLVTLIKAYVEIAKTVVVGDEEQ